MNKKYLLLLVVFVNTAAFSGSGKMQEYKAGPAVFLQSTGGAGAAYYFAKNNALSLGVWAIPYKALQNSNGTQDLNSNKTALGADFLYHQPLMKNFLNNQVFLIAGVGWGQVFGTVNNRPIQYSWESKLELGFEYRFNPHLYFCLVANPYSYTETKFKNFPNKMSHQGIFASAGIAVVYKF